MPGSITYDPGDVVLAGFATPIGVYRYDPDAAAGQRFRLLPNVVCEHAGQYREGAEPAVARFRYVFDGSNPETPFPRTFAEVWPLTSTGPYVVQPDDRIVVRAFTGQGQSRVLFDGFATIPQVDLGEDGHSVTFTAVDVSARLWDEPVASARYYNLYGDDPDVQAVVATDLDVRFNPSGSSGSAAQPNCTLDAAEQADDPIGGEDVGDHPVFIDHRLVQDPEVRTYWTLGKMVRYLLSVHNDREYVDNPDFSVLDQLLDCYAPKADGFYDPEDPDTYDARPILIRDFDATNKSLPDALEDQLGYHGFAYRFATEEDAAGEPWHYIEIYRKDAAGGAPLELRLQEEGATLDFGHSNVADLHAARDTQSVANEFVVATEPIKYEVSVVLAPMFEVDATDATEANRKKFLKSAIKSGTGLANRWKYRRYGVDESGEGHWSFADAETVTIPFDFSSVFASLTSEGTADLRTLGRRAPLYVKRLRPGQDTLLTKDATGKPLKAQLDISRDYAGAYPAVWDGTGTWQTIGTGGWELLKDRLGILVTTEDPEKWNIGKNNLAASDQQEDGTDLRGITSIADPSATEKGTKKFFLRLTTVIEGDFMVEALAARREASPTRFVVQRRIDARDHFRQELVSPYSLHNTDVEDEMVLRDDQLKAKAHAEALRAAHEFAPLAGSVTIPWISFSYEVGQRVDVIDGRGISLRTNIGAEAGEAPQYPTIVSKSWDLSGGKQRTVLQLSDRRAEPQRA